MSDLISRQAAIDVLFDFAGCIVDTPNGDYHKAYQAYRHRLEIMPPAQPQRTGRWIHVQYPYSKCSICGEELDTLSCEANYCPNCGARMEGEP